MERYRKLICLYKKMSLVCYAKCILGLFQNEKRDSNEHDLNLAKETLDKIANKKKCVCRAVYAIIQSRRSNISPVLLLWSSFDEFVCKTRYIQKQSYEIMTFFYFIVHAFNRKRLFSCLRHNWLQWFFFNGFGTFALDLLQQVFTIISFF